jgi:probable rRNA maturation factor
MTVAISNRQRTKKINLRLLKQITSALLVEMQIKNAELGINLVGAKEMAEMNRKFLKHEGSTDVITFDHMEKREQIYGELFICVDDAVSQAKNFKTSWQSEIIRYIVHGVLHLLGYNDLKPDLRHQMKRAENRLVRRLAKKFSLAQIGARSKISA